MNKRHSEIIIRPLITEKSAAQMEKGQYTFEVAKNANKVEIAQALEQILKELYPKSKSEIVSVNTSAIRGRFRRSKRHGRAPKDSKKAIVTISGEPLELFSA
ncbi:MAG: 50S ribosomal protein L23 [Candidatus Melainabacteria bacterium]|jgi:large subunit ribosomal protein L23|uniref:Large ribosomal subunit protein uL23 n=1 Tax=Candidatus Obscuribacter phosphatis TaxID=1906157 RepID=A0A8J7P742_9BACT|nr:50S ribosomal protein L23 [Candidatus Obscuribacter phosphatis]MBX9940377.1 50S ribosomal protein L23 [Candidatus Obscuribacterales bacterium]MCA0313462.1 50S ribosomal protein L23 [Candidatus Melainabacteria bacterium]OPZ91846.1 MAG: 50S ribosomal protein L23 [bacterium ADurb.Bin425]